MKTKILTLFAALALLSCKKEETTPLCNCREVTFARGTQQGAQFTPNSQTAASRMDCWRHGQINQEWQTTDPVTLKITMWRKQIVCD